MFFPASELHISIYAHFETALHFSYAFAASFAFQAIALIWFAPPWLRGLSGLQSFFSQPHQDANRAVGLVVVSVEAAVIDASEGAEW